ncbi:MAG TPA: BON domain-containing protein [Candidatus Limnocylindria bacterium]
MRQHPVVRRRVRYPLLGGDHRVIGQPDGPVGPDVAGTAPTDAGELERSAGVQVRSAARPTDDELTADVLEALRGSDVVAGDRIRVATEGRRVVLSGQVESIDVLHEILGIVGDLAGVDEVIDRVEVTRA